MAASTPNPPPEPLPEESVDAVPTESTFRRWVREAGKGVRWFVTVVIVALVGALVTAVVKGCGGPDELGADLSGVKIDRNVTLDEYALRHARASTSTPTRATVVRLAAHLVAQTPSEDPTTTDDDTTNGATPDGSTTDGSTTDGTTPDDVGIVRRP